jgi:hypothetical protein
MARPKGKGKKTSTAPEGFPDKTWNKLGENWRDAAQAKQTEELEREIINSVRNIANLSFDMKNDDKLTALVEMLKEKKSFYTETIDIEKAKVDFCVYLFNSRGMPVTVSTDTPEEDA